MVIGGCHKVGGGGEVGGLHHNYSPSDMADVVQPLCTMEDSFTSYNSGRVVIVKAQLRPYLKTLVEILNRASRRSANKFSGGKNEFKSEKTWT